MKQNLFLPVSLAIIMTTTAAFSQNKQASYSYKYSAKSVSYATKSSIHEILDVQGQSMDVYVTSAFGCKIKSAGNQLLNVTMDSLYQVVDSPQGAMGGPVTDIKDKSFNLGITPTGKVTDLSGAKAITYTIPGSEPGNVSTSFADFFPVLPDVAVTPGYTWTTVDTIKTEGSGTTQVNILSANYKFDGFEDMNGMRCAKFTGETQGTSSMRNQMQGMDMKTSGSFTGSTVTWFAVSEGYFVKFTENTKMKGNMEMPNEGYSFPITMDIIKTTEAVK